jgi:carbonic anhydrase
VGHTLCGGSRTRDRGVDRRTSTEISEREQEMTTEDYEGMDKLRKDYHAWLKTRINMVRADTAATDRRIFTLTEAFMTEIDFLSNDLSDRTKTLLEQTNFLWTYTRIMGDTLLFLAKKIEKIEPVTDQINKFEEQLQVLFSMKDQLDTHVKKQAEQIRNQIQQQKERVDNDMPGVV